MRGIIYDIYCTTDQGQHIIVEMQNRYQEHFVEMCIRDRYNVSDVHDLLYGIDPRENVEGKVSIHYVGYYYNPLLGCLLYTSDTSTPETDPNLFLQVS